MKIALKIKLIRDGVDLPAYQTEGSAGMDLHAALDEPINIEPGQRVLIPTGVAIAIPEGYEGQVRPRSGLAIKQGLGLVNSPGTIDSDYRGEIGVIMINCGTQGVVIRPNERIAQLVIAPVVRADLVQVDSLDETGRGTGGFGHTGK